MLRDDPNESSAVCLLILMINTLYVEQISRQINFFAENIKVIKRRFFFVEKTFDHPPSAGQRKRLRFTNMQIWPGGEGGTSL